METHALQNIRLASVDHCFVVQTAEEERRMSYPVKRKVPAKLTREAIQAALNMQAPLDAAQPEYKRKKPVRRSWNDAMPEMGEKK
jgi:hypothetical protein